MWTETIHLTGIVRDLRDVPKNDYNDIKSKRHWNNIALLDRQVAVNRCICNFTLYNAETDKGCGIFGCMGSACGGSATFTTFYMKALSPAYLGRADNTMRVSTCTSFKQEYTYQLLGYLQRSPTYFISITRVLLLQLWISSLKQKWLSTLHNSSNELHKLNSKNFDSCSSWYSKSVTIHTPRRVGHDHDPQTIHEGIVRHKGQLWRQPSSQNVNWGHVCHHHHELLRTRTHVTDPITVFYIQETTKHVWHDTSITLALTSST